MIDDSLICLLAIDDMDVTFQHLFVELSFRKNAETIKRLSYVQS
jgi:hypothetical protein